MSAQTITYRILPAAEWDRLHAIYAPYGDLPAPEVATCAVAEINGEIVGVLFLQLALHMEPLVIEDSHVNFLRLQQTLHDALTGRGVSYYAFVGDDNVARIASLAGMRSTGMTVWEGEVDKAKANGSAKEVTQ